MLHAVRPPRAVRNQWRYTCPGCNQEAPNAYGCCGVVGGATSGSSTSSRRLHPRRTRCPRRRPSVVGGERCSAARTRNSASDTPGFDLSRAVDGPGGVAFPATGREWHRLCSSPPSRTSSFRSPRRHSSPRPSSGCLAAPTHRTSGRCPPSSSRVSVDDADLLAKLVPATPHAGKRRSRSWFSKSLFCDKARWHRRSRRMS